MLELKGGGRGGVEGGGRKIIWSVFSRVPALCSLLQPGLCVPIYKALCARARGKLNHVFFLYAVFCHCSEARIWTAEKKATPTRVVFLSKSPFLLLPMKSNPMTFFPSCGVIFLKFVGWVPESLQLGGNLPLFKQYLGFDSSQSGCCRRHEQRKEGEREGSAGYEDMSVLNSLMYSAPWDIWMSYFCFSLL